MDYSVVDIGRVPLKDNQGNFNTKRKCFEEPYGVELVHTEYVKLGTFPRIICLASFGASALKPYANHPNVRAQIDAMISKNRDAFASMGDGEAKRLFADSMRGYPLMYTSAGDLHREAHGDECLPLLEMTLLPSKGNSSASSASTTLPQKRDNIEKEAGRSKKVTT